MNTHTEGDTIVLQVFNDTLSATLAQSKLQEAGIESFLQDENVVGLNPLGGVELKIFSKDLELTKKTLSV